jgi:hypothetical protein
MAPRVIHFGLRPPYNQGHSFVEPAGPHRTQAWEMDDLNPRIRVLIANVPPMVAHILAYQIRTQPDMMLAGQVQGQVETLVAASAGADVVILGHPDVDSTPGLVSHLLTELPHLKVLALSHREDLATEYFLDIRRGRTVRVTGESLPGEVRQLYQQTPGA